MSTLTYKAALRGQLVSVDEGNYAPIFTKPTISATVIGGIGSLNNEETAGTATGNLFTEREFTWIEVIRVYPSSVAGIPSVTTIYLEYGLVKVKPNPAYDASKDTGNPTRGTKLPPGTGDVSKVPGEGRIPVPTGEGGTVYVPVPRPFEAPVPADKSMLYALFAILGIAVVTILVILIKSASTVGESQSDVPTGRQAPRPALMKKSTSRS